MVAFARRPVVHGGDPGLAENCSIHPELDPGFPRRSARHGLGRAPHAAGDPRIAVARKRRAVEQVPDLRLFAGRTDDRPYLFEHLIRRLAGQRAPLDPEPAFRRVGRQAGAAFDQGAVQRRRPHERVPATPQLTAVELLERRDDAPHPADRAHAEVPAAAVGEDELPGARLGDDAAVRFVTFDEIDGAQARVLLVGHERNEEPAAESSAPRHGGRRRHHRRRRALHVVASAAIDPARLEPGLERRDGHVGGAHGIEVSTQHERGAGFARHLGHGIGPARRDGIEP